MGKLMKYIDNDVLSESKIRLHHVMDLFDSHVVLFSGGKDSLTAMSLVRDVQRERGINEKVPVVFWDQEFFVKDIINYVKEVRSWDWVDLRWVCPRLEFSTLMLDETTPIMPWDNEREWVRQPPEFAEFPMGDRVWSKKEREQWLSDQFPGLTAFITGVRAAESLVRFRASINKRTDNYICSTTCGSAKIIKPIFDWKENDVYKYIHETPDIDLPTSYQMNVLVQMPAKTSTVTHRNAAKYLDKIKFIDPDLYENMVSILPWVHAHATYWKDIDIEGIIRRYGKSYALVRLWIDENLIDPKVHASAVKTFEHAFARAEESPWAYTPERFLKHFLYGNFGGTIMPCSTTKNKFIKEHYREIR